MKSAWLVDNASNENSSYILHGKCDHQSSRNMSSTEQNFLGEKGPLKLDSNLSIKCNSCYDGLKNNEETGTDCGGNCQPCILAGDIFLAKAGFWCSDFNARYVSDLSSCISAVSRIRQKYRKSMTEFKVASIIEWPSGCSLNYTGDTIYFNKNYNDSARHVAARQICLSECLSNNDCLNDGTCNGGACLCKLGFNGRKCEKATDKDFCVGEVCLRGGDSKSGNLYVREKSVCDGGWDIEAAHVTCRNLGHAGARVATVRSEFGPVKHFGMDNVKCVGNETTIEDCDYTISRCSSSTPKAAGVQCFEDVAYAEVRDGVVYYQVAYITGHLFCEFATNASDIYLSVY